MRAIITEYGAVGDGKSLNTGAIQRAVNKCFESGGGTVVVPAGIFVSGTVELKSHVSLHIEQGGVLKASENIGDYVKSPYSHHEWGNTTSLIYALNQSDIFITGEGSIDLSGDAFMNYSRAQYQSILPEEMTREQFEQTECDLFERPNQPIFFHECKRLGVNGIQVRNSPCWTFSFSMCRDIKINNISIDNNLRIPNSDGIHLCSCKDVIITGCVFSCADDCVAMTCVTNWEEPCERVVVSNCTMRTKSAGIRMGHKASKIRNVTISNIIVYNSNRGIGIFAEREGGWVKSVSISGVIMETCMFAGNWWGKGEPLVISAGGQGTRIEDITVTDVKATSENGILIIGDEQNIGRILLKDWKLSLKDCENRKLFGTKLDIQPRECLPAPDGGHSIPWLYASDIESLRLDAVYYGKAFEEDREFNFEGVFKDIKDLKQSEVIKMN